MAKGNILKEAIADAKAVREVALANAKAALEEAFTPKLQNMLNAKLQEDLDETYYDEDEKMDEMMYDEDDVEEGMGMYDEDEKDMDEGHMDGHGMYDEDEKDSMDEEIDLEEILNELELEEEADSKDTEMSEDAKDLEEYGGLNPDKMYYTPDVVSKVTTSEKNIYEDDKNFDLDALLKEINDLEEEKEDKKEEVKTEAKKEDDDKVEETKKDDDKEDMTENFGCKQKEHRIKFLSRQLHESKKAFNEVQNELNEVNLLNSKLLYVNRIFKANQLDEGQKLRVVETLDKAESVKDAKLIYETIKDTFKVANTKKVSSKKQTKKTIKESFRGMASKAAGMSRTKKTAPKRAIISESDNMVNRFQKLANIKINE